MRFGVLAAAYMVVMITLPVVDAYSADPAPLLKLLKDSLDSLSSGDYNLSKELVGVALSVNVGSLNHTHRNAYSKLNSLLDLLITSKSLNSSANTTYLRGLIYDLYRAYHNLNASITSYVDALTQSFRDPVLRGKYLSEFHVSLRSAYDVIDEVLNDLVMRYLGITSYVLNTSLWVPEAVYGGGDYELTVYVAAPNDVEYVDAFIYVNYGGLYSFLNTSIPTNEYHSITLKAPPAEEFLVMDYRLVPEVGFEVLVRVYGASNNYTYVGQGVCRGLLKFLRPELTITPKLVDSSLTSLVINASLSTPLNASIFIDDRFVSSSELLRGVYEFPLNVDLSGGRLVRVVTEGRGPYLSSSWTYRLVSPTTPKVGVYVDTLALIPPFTTSITLEVGVTPYVLKLSVCGNEFEELINTSVTSLNVSLPWNAALWCDLRVDVMSLGGVLISSKSLRIYVVNIPLLMSLIAGPLTVAALPSTRRYLRGLKTYVPKLVGYGRGEREARTLYVGISFKESKLSKTYRKFVGLISRYVEPPKGSETLREFLARIAAVFTNPVYELITSFIISYESSLYSRHAPDPELMGKVLMKLRSMLRRAQEPVRDSHPK